MAYRWKEDEERFYSFANIKYLYNKMAKVEEEKKTKDMNSKMILIKFPRIYFSYYLNDEENFRFELMIFVGYFVYIMIQTGSV